MKRLRVTVVAHATELSADTWGHVDVRHLVHPLTLHERSAIVSRYSHTTRIVMYKSASNASTVLANAESVHTHNLYDIPEREWATAQQVPLSRPCMTVRAKCELDHESVIAVCVLISGIILRIEVDLPVVVRSAEKRSQTFSSDMGNRLRYWSSLHAPIELPPVDFLSKRFVVLVRLLSMLSVALREAYLPHPAGHRLERIRSNDMLSGLAMFLASRETGNAGTGLSLPIEVMMLGRSREPARRTSVRCPDLCPFDRRHHE